MLKTKMAGTKQYARMSTGGKAPHPHGFIVKSDEIVFKNVPSTHVAQSNLKEVDDGLSNLDNIFTKFVSLCINGKHHELKTLIGNGKSQIEELLLYDAKDSITGYNICEYVTLYGCGSLHIMERLEKLKHFGTSTLGRALEFAIIKGKIEMLTFFLNPKNRLGVSNGKVVYLSLKHEKELMLEAILKIEKEIDVDDDIGNECFNALHAFSAEGKLEAVEWLLRNNADPNRTGRGRKTGWKTALHIATEKGHLNIMKCLIENKAYVNTKTKNFRVTPIQIARKH